MVHVPKLVFVVIAIALFIVGDNVFQEKTNNNPLSDEQVFNMAMVTHTEAAEGGNTTSMLWLAYLLLKDKNDMQNASMWVQKALDKGCTNKEMFFKVGSLFIEKGEEEWGRILIQKSFEEYK